MFDLRKRKESLGIVGSWCVFCLAVAFGGFLALSEQ
jgi:hypothetical protein